MAEGLNTAEYQENPLRKGMRIRTLPQPCTMVIFGASGDLTRRKIMPALYNLALENHLPSEFSVVGFARREKKEFREEMRQTRVTADQLLAEGKLEEAETYMEARRAVFWENGYRLRKLNQAYFAFYGAYADEPGGEAGDDPVGAAVRAFFSESPSLAAFLKRIAWMTSFEDLQGAVGSHVN